MTLFGEPLAVRQGEWDYSNPKDQQVLVESALSVHFDPSAYHPDVDLDMVTALTRAWGDGVRVFGADKPGDEPDGKEQTIF